MHARLAAARGAAAAGAVAQPATAPRDTLPAPPRCAFPSCNRLAYVNNRPGYTATYCGTNHQQFHLALLRTHRTPHSTGPDAARNDNQPALLCASGSRVRHTVVPQSCLHRHSPRPRGALLQQPPPNPVRRPLEYTAVRPHRLLLASAHRLRRHRPRVLLLGSRGDRQGPRRSSILTGQAHRPRRH